MIRKLLKWFIYLCLLLLAGIVVLILCKDTILRNLTERRITAQTGMYVRIDRLHVGFREPILSIQGFKLYNRPEFGGGLLLHLNDLHVEYDPDAVKSGELHLNLFRLDLEQLNIIRNAAGQTNIVEFIESAGTKGLEAMSLNLPAREFGFTGIDTLDLSIGRIRFIDLRDPRRNRETYFGVQNETIRNIRNEDDLYGVAGIVLLRSGIIPLSNPSGDEDSASAGILDLGWDWLVGAMGLDPGWPPSATTNAVPGVRWSP